MAGRILELLSSKELPVRQAAVWALGSAGSGLRWGMLLVVVAGIAAAAADEPVDSTEELPNQRLLEDVIVALLPENPRARMEQRDRLKELAAAWRSSRTRPGNAGRCCLRPSTGTTR